jgi:hypothetical protein
MDNLVKINYIIDIVKIIIHVLKKYYKLNNK